MEKFDLKELMNSKGITAYEVGKNTGVPTPNITNILNGKRRFENMGLASAIKILKYICSEKELFEIIKKYF